MASRYEKWEIGDYARHFLTEAQRSSDETFRDKFHALGSALEGIDAEFLRQNADCGGRIGGLLHDLHSLAGRLGYCETDRGFESDCSRLYADVDAAIAKSESLEEGCFI